jgi:hypothetical protein
MVISTNGTRGKKSCRCDCRAHLDWDFTGCEKDREELSSAAKSPGLLRKDQVMRKYSYLLWAGMICAMGGIHYYPPLDGERLIGWSIGLFFLPIVLNLVALVWKRLAADLGWLRTAYLCCGGALLLLGSYVIANGGLDKAPVKTESSVVTLKNIVAGRHSKAYTLRVPSWRSDRDEEELRVNHQTYNKLKVGQEILVEVHPGFLGMPWYGQVTPGEQAKR